MSHPPRDLDHHLALARDLAREAADFILARYSPQGCRFDTKSDGSPVTAADRGAEELIRRRLERERPHDAVLGEEFGPRDGSSGVRWILDPIDGTRSFVSGVPLFGTMIGVEVDGAFSVGVVRFPALDEELFARTGGGAFFRARHADPAPARVSSTANLADAVLCVTDPRVFVDALGPDRAARAAAPFKVVRSWSDCYAHMLVATGRADAAVDAPMALWDVAALAPIVTEAGGSFTDWHGHPTTGPGGAVSTTPALWPALAPLIRR
jgi:histidinol-phosphatase